MSRRRTERLVNLVLCLLSTRRFLTAAQIAGIVPGYEYDPDDPKVHEAFQRMFERDKGELRELGVPLETGTNSVFDTEPGYRIARNDYELPELHLDPEEAAAVGIAAQLWHHAQLSNAASSGLVKLRAGGVDLAEGPPLGIEPVVSVDPAFSPMLAAIDVRRCVRFSYRTPRDGEARQRQLRPWGVVSWRGRWYVVGHDLDRDATRCFRLSRVVGEVAAFGPKNAFAPPEGLDLVGQVAAFDPEPVERKTALVRLRVGAAAGLRRLAEKIEPERPEAEPEPGPELFDADVSAALSPPRQPPEAPDEVCGEDEQPPDTKAAWDLVTIGYSDPESIAARLAGYGSAVVALSPPEVRDAVIRILTSIAGSPVTPPAQRGPLDRSGVAR